MLADKKFQIRTSDNQLIGFVHSATPQMIQADQRAQQQSHKQANSALTKYSVNMACTQSALSDFQDSVQPIIFHRFNNISVPDSIDEPRNYKVSVGTLIHVLTELGLIDGGANGGISNGKDMKLICYHPDNQRVNISDVGNHLINDKRLASFCAVVSTDAGPKLGIWHNYAYVPEQQGTIHLTIQMKANGILVSDNPRACGGHALMRHPDGVQIPIVFCYGLPYICQRYPTKEEFLNLDQIIMTDESDWNPCIFDNKHLPDDVHLWRIPSTPILAQSVLCHASKFSINVNNIQNTMLPI